jgi:hypothetical protein
MRGREDAAVLRKPGQRFPVRRAFRRVLRSRSPRCAAQAGGRPGGARSGKWWPGTPTPSRRARRWSAARGREASSEFVLFQQSDDRRHQQPPEELRHDTPPLPRNRRLYAQGATKVAMAGSILHVCAGHGGAVILPGVQPDSSAAACGRARHPVRGPGSARAPTWLLGRSSSTPAPQPALRLSGPTAAPAGRVLCVVVPTGAAVAGGTGTGGQPISRSRQRVEVSGAVRGSGWGRCRRRR